MSIATVGPKKYDFQDLVCVDVFLRHQGEESVELYIEPKAGEDAKVIIPSASGKKVIEIQVKGALEGVTLAEFAKWLSHFEERKAVNTLLERLCDDLDTHVVFVVSARCSDKISVLCKSATAPWDVQGKKLSREVAGELLGELENYASTLEETESSLDDERVLHLRKFVKGAKVDQIRNALARLTIVENVLEDELRDACERKLRKLRLPLDRCEVVVGKLVAIIKKAKESKGNIHSDLLAELNKNLPEQIRPRNYVLRGFEEDWKKELSENNILLLSGSPRVGKTNAGRWMAAEFEALGYQLKLSSNLDEVERFLLDPAPGERLAVVDDPLGGSFLSDDPGRALSKLQQLSERLTPSRKLIVSQVQDRLLQFSGDAQLEDVWLGRRRWHDLGKYRSSFLVEIWQELQNLFDVPDVLSENMLGALRSGSLSIEPGCLMHLAASCYRLHEPADLNAAVRLAREDSKSLASALVGEGLSPLLQALAVVTSHEDSCSLQDLKYVLNGDGTKNRYAVASYLGLSASLGMAPKPVDRVPETYGELTFSAEDETLFEILERRRIIVETGAERFNFSHEFYRSAAELSASGRASAVDRRLLQYAERGLFSLSFESSRATAIALRWIYEAMRASVQRHKVVDFAIEGLESRYLVTKEACFFFLLQSIEDISEGKRSQFNKWVNKVSFVTLKHVLWEKGQAMLPAGENFTLEGKIFEFYEREEVEGFLIAFSGESDEEISAEDAWKTMCYLEGCPEELTQPIVLRLLSYDLGGVRAAAAKVWISSVRHNDQEVLKKIFSDQHPSVAQAALEGAARIWPECDSDRQRDLLAGLKRCAALPASASTMIAIILKMEHQAYGNELPWGLFGGLLPDILSALPEGANLNDARLHAAVEKSLKHIAQSDFINIADAWIGLLEREALRAIPSDYAMAVTDLLIRGTEAAPDLRGTRLDRLFKVNGTGAQIRVVLELVDGWDLLTAADRTQVLGYLSEDRVDQRWLHATAVTRYAVPPEVVALVFPSGALPTVVTLSGFESTLIECALKIYMGNPGILGNIGAHLAGGKTWEPIVESIALNPDHALFNKAWAHITSSSDDEKVSNFVSKLVGQYPQEMFDRLLEHKVRTNGGFMPGAWEILLDHAPVGKLDIWLAVMATHAQRVLDELVEVRDWVGERYANSLLRLFPADVELLNTVYSLKEAAAEAFAALDEVKSEGVRRYVVNELLRNFMDKFKAKLPVHYSTCDAICRLFKDIGSADADLEEIEAYRLKLLKLAHEYTFEEYGEKLEFWEA
ncbi:MULTISPECIES: hypothetical protein [unclassified Pseudomonas]|uniref:nSTAND3 domain-containing NTPase n=1 Tax=unclassified Pseudomonas TaxID=196821 RepID=UPI000A1ED6FA|nr:MULTISPECIES: hypothetical protein [unclassified Pseudomonas]